MFAGRVDFPSPPPLIPSRSRSLFISFHTSPLYHVAFFLSRLCFATFIFFLYPFPNFLPYFDIASLLALSNVLLTSYFLPLLASYSFQIRFPIGTPLQHTLFLPFLALLALTPLLIVSSFLFFMDIHYYMVPPYFLPALGPLLFSLPLEQFSSHFIAFKYTPAPFHTRKKSLLIYTVSPFAPSYRYYGDLPHNHYTVILQLLFSISVLSFSNLRDLTDFLPLRPFLHHFSVYHG